MLGPFTPSTGSGVVKIATESSAGVGNTSVSQLNRAFGLFLARLIDASAIDQLDRGLLSDFLVLKVLVTAIEKGWHGMFLVEIQVPVPWPGMPALRRSEVNDW